MQSDRKEQRDWRSIARELGVDPYGSRRAIVQAMTASLAASMWAAHEAEDELDEIARSVVRPDSTGPRLQRSA